MKARLATGLLFLFTSPVWAQSVAMTGSMGSKALLVVDGAPPKAVAAGDTHKGVKVLSVSGSEAVVEVKGQRLTVAMGGAPVSVKGSGTTGGTRIILNMGLGGHFMTQGQINGRAVNFMVDTGATSIAIGQADADRMGIRYKEGVPTMVGTANGTAPAYRVNLNSVRVQDVEVYNVEALVLGVHMPYALLGNSFLGRFQMKRENDVLMLDKRF